MEMTQIPKSDQSSVKITAEDEETGAIASEILRANPLSQGVIYYPTQSGDSTSTVGNNQMTSKSSEAEYQ